MPRGPSLGHTAYLPDKDLHNTTKEQLIARIDVALGGRQAEEMIYGTDDDFIELQSGCAAGQRGQARGVRWKARTSAVFPKEV